MVGDNILEQLKATNDYTEFHLRNTNDTDIAVHEKLRKYFKQWVKAQGFSEEKTRKVWAATWEAVINAIRHGSRQEDVITIRLLAKDKDNIDVEIMQPQKWYNCGIKLGEGRKAMLSSSVKNIDDIVFGGTVVMLRLADKVFVSKDGRVITMRFSNRALVNTSKGI